MCGWSLGESNLDEIKVEEVKDYGTRINRLVDEFESHIHSHLNEEYIKSTKWSDKFADKLQSLVVVGSLLIYSLQY
jgi:hypothetical protein